MTDKEIPEHGSAQASGQVASILVVEDEGIIAKDLERRLLNQGYIVSSVVASGEDAIRKVEECRPNLVLMDIVLLGDIDGIEAAAEIRRLFAVPVIYLTAYADDRIIERAKHTEPYGYIIKPFNDRELRSSIEMALYKHGMEQKLRESEHKLRMHAMELEESNTALKVLLKQRENDRKEVEENILSNVKQLILPYLEKLIENMTKSEYLPYLKIVERNLKEIISPFSFRLSSKYIGFTPREIAIADLIRDGKQDKDIMELLNISYETVKSHRQNIRRKLGIYSKRTNLRAHLLTLGK